MMSYLYPEDEVTFDKSGFGPLPDMLVSYAEEEANSYFELYFEYPLFSSHERGDYNQVYVNMSDYIIEGNQITYKPSHSREPHAFRIYKTEKQVERGIILVWARTRTADLRGNPVRKVVSNGAPVSSALRALKLASEETHPFSFTTNIQSNISFEKYQTNVLDALAGEEDSILAITGGQMIRTNNNIYIGINESSKNVVEFRLGKNIEGLSYEVDYSNMVTAVIPFYTQTYKLVDDVRDEIVRDSSGNIVKNSDGTTKYNRTVGKKRESLDKEVIVYGDTVFSQYANDYSTPFYSFVEIRDDREDPGVDEDPLPPFTKADINSRAADWFEWEENLGVDEPEVSVTVDVHDISQSSEYSHDLNLAKLETLNVFDKALVYVPEVGIDMEMEINYIRYDGVAEKNLEVRLGTTLTSLTETVLSPQQRAFNQRVQQLDREITKSLMSSDGKSRVYWMATKPVGQFEIGDLWFDITLEGGIYVWDGYDWVAKLPPEFGKLIEDSVNEAIEAADLAMQEAQTAAGKALEDAKAYAEEQDRLVKQQVTTSVNTAISTAEAAKADAKTKSDQALVDAKAYADAQDLLIKQQVNTSVGTALSTAEAAKATAESSYTNAVAEAERLVGAQTTAFNKKFEENATEIGTVSQAAKDADAKAQSALNKAGVNANTLTTHQNTLNTINNTTIPAVRSSAQDALANAKSAMDEAKLAESKIVNYVTTNGLVNGTTVDNKINTATGEINNKITTVESKIPTEIGGRNLLTGTHSELKAYTKSSWDFYLHRINANKLSYHGIELGTKLTYRVYIDKPTEAVRAHIQFVKAPIAYVQYYGNLISAGQSGYSTITLEVTNNDLKNLDYIQIAVRGTASAQTTNLAKKKLEIGSIPSDWTPAPEDIQSVADLDANITAIYTNETSETAKAINKTLSAYTLETNFNSKTQAYLTNNQYQTASQVTTTLSAYTKTTSLDSTVASYLNNSTSSTAGAINTKLTAYQTTTGLDSSVATLLSNTNSQTAEKINSKLTVIEGKIPTEIGGRNLIVQSNITRGKYLTVTGGETNSAEWFYTDFIPVSNYKNLVTSGYSNLGSAPSVVYYDSSKVFVKGVNNANLARAKNITIDSGIAFIRFSGMIKDLPTIKLEQGTIPTDWTPAPEDMATVIKTNEIERTADYSKLAITNLSKNGVVESSSVNATKDGITERVAKVDANGNISYSNRNVKLDSIVTTIADQNYISQQVQGSNIIQNTIATIVPAGANLLKNSDFRDVVTGVTFNGGGATSRAKNTYPAGWGGYNSGAVSDPTNNWHAFLNDTTFNFNVVEFNETDGTRHWKGISRRLDNNQYAKINPTASYIFSVDTYSNGTGTKLFGGFYYTKKGGTSPSFHAGRFNIPVTTANKWERLSVKVPLDSDVDLSKSVSFYIYGYGFTTNSYLYIKNISLTEGDITAGWSLSPEDTATQSQVTQLQESWSMQLTKADDVVTQINATSAGVLIQGKNLILDGNVTMTSTFSVPDANIAGLSVNKITGTNAQFTTMVTKGLTADVITSTMIKADTALFDMLFSTTSATSRLVAQGAWITNANIVSLDASKINAGTIATARLDAGAIVTAGLTANVVTSTHIQSSVALVEKIFATDAYVTTLTSKAIFATNVRAINIDASKITSGTIAAARIDAALVVSSGLVTNVVKSTHIESSVALVEKIFATDANVTTLTSKAVFATNVRAINIDAARITSGTIAAARIDAALVVSSGLVTNVVKSAHIESSTGLIDKIFATDAYIQRMTSKTAFISSIQAINISASTITSGTLDANKVTVKNLDASSITANQANLVKAGLTSSSGGSLDLSGDQILSTASDGSQTSIGAGRVNFRNPDGANLGGIGYEDYGASPYLTLRTSWGSHFRITARQEVSAGNVIDKHVLTVTAGKEMYLNTDNTYVTGDMTMQRAVKVGGHLSLSGGEVNRLSRVRFNNGAYLEEQSNGNTQLKSAGTQLQFYQASGRIMYSDGTRLFLDLSINMQGNGVLNQSDARMKTDIRKIEQDSLSIIKGTDFVNYKMISNGRETFGFIAQQMQKVAPHLIKDEDGTLAFDSMEWTQTVAHGLQQLNTKVDKEIAQLKEQVATLQKELALAKGA